MEILWERDEQGRLDPPLMTGFSMTQQPNGSTAVQIRAADPEVREVLGNRRFQFAVNALLARDLAAALIEAAKLMESTPVLTEEK
jgi:hypothetical protein